MLATQSIITQLIPFNPSRFDLCMAYLAHEVYRRPLTLFEMIKLHVMLDVYHVLEHAHQAIGGELEPWPYGPVVAPAYQRLKNLEEQREQSNHQFQPAQYSIIDADITGFQPTTADFDELAPSEQAAADRAARLLKPMSFDDVYRFFHSDDTFMGRAYNIAKRETRAIAWPDIIDAHDQLHGTSLASLKRRLIPYG
jgi:hypothetical protein